MEKLSSYISVLIPFFLLISVVLLDILIITGVLSEFYQDKDTVLAGIIAFWGAVLGGTITFLGVQYTLFNQRKMNYAEKIPEIVVNSWKIYKIVQFGANLKSYVKSYPEIDDVKKVEKFYDANELWASELSAKTSLQWYRLVDKYFTHLSDYHSYKKNNRIDEWHEKAEELALSSMELIDKYEKEYDEYGK
ncbi:hypothetical protein CSV63_02905 [Sporosarcina sp. P34]|uniref:hypothetical protein n=1 Tax=Sporosarcina sp. P34 TaxID=2048247 RepID=UPI000C16FBA5|nr:hypothetical protein [Sporosarcina sp. P34]PID16854.1 hypothetical protein CSV63_02905 [Sporosarcina sp. P34]